VQKAKVSKPVLYYYFKDKEDLCRSLFSEGVEKFEQATLANINKNIPVEKFIEEILDKKLKFFRENRKIARLAMRVMNCAIGEHRFFPIVEKMRRAKREILRQALKNAEKRGGIAKGKTEDIIHMISAVIEHFMIELQYGDSGQFDKNSARRFAKIILNGIKPAKTK
jgi:AcrR family transcriptional regulator